MRKTLIVASSEFATLVRSKAFLISLALMPVLSFGSIQLVKLTRDTADTTTRKFAVIDGTGGIYPALAVAVAARNQDPTTTARFEIERVDPGERPLETVRLDLSDRIRRKELFAFVELPRGVLEPASGESIRYHSGSPSYQILPNWLRLRVTEIVVAHRFLQASVDPKLITQLMMPPKLNALGLVERSTDGTVKEAERVNELRTFAVPAAMLLLMYITVMSSAPQLLNGVIEEKMSRISEVLIGSVTPFQLMLGKLTGSVGVSLLLAAIYGTGGLAVAKYWGVADAVTLPMAGWFTLFLTIAVLIFGSLFIAIGAACTDLKDSQNMMTPVMVLIILPLVSWAGILRAPDSTTSLVLSLIPTATPFLMLLRIAIAPGPPLWQVLLAVVISTATTLAIVWAAGRIFRTGILMQGKSATLGEMVRWVRMG